MDQFYKESPCLSCKRCPIPSLCEDKCCSIWRKWILARWEMTRKLFTLTERR